MASSKALLGTIAMTGFVWLFLVGTLQSEAGKKMAVSVQSSGDVEHEQMIGKQKLVRAPELDLSYMMDKRKVPDGPDPIHNRRAGNSKRPPGRA